MTTYRNVEVVCGGCGTASTQTVLNSTSQFGPSDLDRRPAQIARWTIAYWLQQCPSCGIVSPSLAKISDSRRVAATSAEYQAALADGRLSTLARRFVCAARLDLAEQRTHDAANRYLQAAWVCDDARDRDNAIELRKLAAMLFSQVLQTKDGDGKSTTAEFVLLDVLRRSENWDAAEALASKLGVISDPELSQIVTLQKRLIARRDAGSYRTDGSPNDSVRDL
jgi:hypothetical protein